MDSVMIGETAQVVKLVRVGGKMFNLAHVTDVVRQEGDGSNFTRVRLVHGEVFVFLKEEADRVWCYLTGGAFEIG